MPRSRPPRTIQESMELEELAIYQRWREEHERRDQEAQQLAEQRRRNEALNRQLDEATIQTQPTYYYVPPVPVPGEPSIGPEDFWRLGTYEGVRFVSPDAETRPPDREPEPRPEWDEGTAYRPSEGEAANLAYDRSEYDRLRFTRMPNTRTRGGVNTDIRGDEPGVITTMQGMINSQKCNFQLMINGEGGLCLKIASPRNTNRIRIIDIFPQRNREGEAKGLVFMRRYLETHFAYGLKLVLRDGTPIVQEIKPEETEPGLPF